MLTAAAESVMGVSVSLLTATTTFFVAAGCFAAGYLLALNFHQHHSAVASIETDDDDDDKESRIKRSLRRRLLWWAPPLIAGGASTAMVEVDGQVQGSKANKKKNKPALEIENLAEILDDFKMVRGKVEIFRVFGIVLGCLEIYILGCSY